MDDREFDEPTSRPRFTGIPTFMRQPYVDIDGDIGHVGEVEIGLIGVPFDGGVTNRPGARHGPREIRVQSTMMRAVHQSSGIQPFRLCRTRDLGDAWVRRPFCLEDALAEIGAFYRKATEKKIVPISAGGDHSITLPILRALGLDAPLALVHVDAHCDTGDDYLGSRFHHGTPFRRAVEEGLIDPRRTIQIGIRGSIVAPDLWAFSRERGMHVVPMEDVDRRGIASVVREVQEVVGDASAYVTFDIDALDPAFAPGTGTPEVGGLTSLQAQLLIRGLRGLDVIGGDVVEVAPPFDPTGVTGLVAASLMYEILCVAAEAVAARRKPCL